MTDTISAPAAAAVVAPNVAPTESGPDLYAIAQTDHERQFLRALDAKWLDLSGEKILSDTQYLGHRQRMLSHERSIQASREAAKQPVPAPAAPAPAPAAPAPAPPLAVEETIGKLERLSEKAGKAAAQYLDTLARFRAEPVRVRFNASREEVQNASAEDARRQDEARHANDAAFDQIEAEFKELVAAAEAELPRGWLRPRTGSVEAQQLSETRETRYWGRLRQELDVVDPARAQHRLMEAIDTAVRFGDVDAAWAVLHETRPYLLGRKVGAQPAEEFERALRQRAGGLLPSIGRNLEREAALARIKATLPATIYSSRRTGRGW